MAEGGKFTNYISCLEEGWGRHQLPGEGNAKEQAGRAALK